MKSAKKLLKQLAKLEKEYESIPENQVVRARRVEKKFLSMQKKYQYLFGIEETKEESKEE